MKRLLGAQVLDVVIRVDGRLDQVTADHLHAGMMPPEVFYRVLDQARDIMRQKELQALAQSNGHPVPPPSPHPAEEN